MAAKLLSLLALLACACGEELFAAMQTLLLSLHSLFPASAELASPHQHHGHGLPAALANVIGQGGQSGQLFLASLISCLSFGFFSSLHCSLMCAPMVSGFCNACVNSKGRASASEQRKSFFKKLLLYNLGRGIGYSCLGALLAAASTSLQFFLPSIGAYLSAVLGSLILIYAFLLLIKLCGLNTGRLGVFLNIGSALERGALRAASLIATPSQESGASSQQPRLGRNPLRLAPLILGILTALLPCMTLTPMLIAASATSSPLEGAQLMAAFFIGTFPMMAIAPSIPALGLRLKTHFPKWTTESIVLFLLAFIGIFTIFRGSDALMSWLH